MRQPTSDDIVLDAAVEAMLDRYGVGDATRTFLTAPRQLYVDGEWTDANGGETLPVIEPATGGSLGTIAGGTLDDLNRAIDAARASLEGEWGQATPAAREKILLRLAELVERDAQTLGEIETLDTGKAIGPCISVDILGSADLLRYMAGFATKIEGATRQVSAPGAHLAMTVKEPIGVVGAIVPWNWPFAMAIWKIAAPLAAGCAVVLKPAQETSLSMLYFARLAEEAGLPRGVLNIVTGDGPALGDALTVHPGIDKIAFTGSTPTGRRVGKRAGRSLIPATLELGGKSPMIVFADADIAAAAAATRWSVFFNAGQVCSAGSRLYVQENRLDAMLGALCEVAAGMQMAPGLDPECDIGPVISPSARNRIEETIARALEQGAECAFRGECPCDSERFVPPTILVARDNGLEVVQEEIFGPVLVVLPFRDEADAVDKANDNMFGLAASIWTRDIERAVRLSRVIKAGTVWVNAHDLVDPAMPFGGVKASGFGRDLGPEQLDHYLTTKTLWISAGGVE